MKVFFNFNKHSQGHFPVGRNWGKAGVLGIKYQAVVARLAVSLCCLGRRAFSVAQPWTTSEWSRVLPQWLGSKSLALAPLAWKVPVIFVTAFFLMLSCTFYDAILNLSWSRLFFFFSFIVWNEEDWANCRENCGRSEPCAQPYFRLLAQWDTWEPLCPRSLGVHPARRTNRTL